MSPGPPQTAEAKRSEMARLQSDIQMARSGEAELRRMMAGQVTTLSETRRRLQHTPPADASKRAEAMQAAVLAEVAVREAEQKIQALSAKAAAREHRLVQLQREMATSAPSPLPAAASPQRAAAPPRSLPGQLPPAGLPGALSARHAMLLQRQQLDDSWLGPLCCGLRKKGVAKIPPPSPATFDVPLLRALMQDYMLPTRLAP